MGIVYIVGYSQYSIVYLVYNEPDVNDLIQALENENNTNVAGLSSAVMKNEERYSAETATFGWRIERIPQSPERLQIRR